MGVPCCLAALYFDLPQNWPTTRKLVRLLTLPVTYSTNHRGSTWWLRQRLTSLELNWMLSKYLRLEARRYMILS